MIISNSTFKLLAISKLKGIGPKALDKISSLSSIDDVELEDIISVHFPKFNYSKKEFAGVIEFANTQVKIATENNHSILSIYDGEFPESLRNTYDAPKIVFCSGNVSIMNSRNITVIGTREPTPHGAVIGRNVSEWFVRKGWGVVSGLAIGIDTIAHQSCIDSGGKTIAVLAHGLDRIYPKVNEGLASDILRSGGLLVTEYAYESFMGKGNFVKRDRIQAALSSSVFLVQTGLKGGSLHASKAILDYQRYLVVLGQSRTDTDQKSEKCLGNLAIINNDFSYIAKQFGAAINVNKNIVHLLNKNMYEDVNKMLKSIKFNGDDKSTSQLF